MCLKCAKTGQTLPWQVPFCGHTTRGTSLQKRGAPLGGAASSRWRLWRTAVIHGGATGGSVRTLWLIPRLSDSIMNIWSHWHPLNVACLSLKPTVRVWCFHELSRGLNSRSNTFLGPLCIKLHVNISGINCPILFQSICGTNSQIYRSGLCPLNLIMIALVDVFALCFYLFISFCSADCIADLIMFGRVLALLSWGSLLALPSQ